MQREREREREYACDGKRHVMNFRLAGNKRRSSKDPHLKRERERERWKQKTSLLCLWYPAKPTLISSSTHGSSCCCCWCWHIRQTLLNIFIPFQLIRADRYNNKSSLLVVDGCNPRFPFPYAYKCILLPSPRCRVFYIWQAFAGNLIGAKRGPYSSTWLFQCAEKREKETGRDRC